MTPVELMLSNNLCVLANQIQKVLQLLDKSFTQAYQSRPKIPTSRSATQSLAPNGARGDLDDDDTFVNDEVSLEEVLSTLGAHYHDWAKAGNRVRVMKPTNGNWMKDAEAFFADHVARDPEESPAMTLMDKLNDHERGNTYIELGKRWRQENKLEPKPRKKYNRRRKDRTPLSEVGGDKSARPAGAQR